MRTGMVHTSLLLAWLFILIRAGSEESAASSPGAVAGFASACISGLRASTGRGTGACVVFLVVAVAAGFGGADFLLLQFSWGEKKRKDSDEG